MIICVGEAVTGASTVTTLRSYAMLGRWQALQAMALNTEYNLTTNLGYPSMYQRWAGEFSDISGSNNTGLAPNGSGGYPIQWTDTTGTLLLRPDLVVRQNTARIRTHATALWIGNVSSGAAYTFTGANANLIVNRDF